MARRRIEKSGSSLAITLPEDIIERLGLDEGAEVSVSVDSEGVSIRLTPVNVPSATGVDQDFAALLLLSSDEAVSITLWVLTESPPIEKVAHRLATGSRSTDATSIP